MQFLKQNNVASTLRKKFRSITAALWLVKGLRLALLLALTTLWSPAAWGQWTDPASGVIFKAVGGLEGKTIAGNQGYANACDSKTWTKLCVKHRNISGDPGTPTDTNPDDVIIKANYPVYVKGYSITTADDNETWYGRNPKSWVLYGSDSQSGPWSVIDSITDDNTIPRTNYTETTFDLTSPCGTAYRYFKYAVTKIWSTSNDNNHAFTQYSEFHLFGNLGYTIHFVNYQDGASVSVADDVNSSATYSTEGASVTTTRLLSSTDITVSGTPAGYTAHTSVDNDSTSCNIMVAFTKPYTLTLVNKPTSGVSVTIDHDYVGGTYTDDAAIEATATLTEEDVHVAAVEGYYATAVVDEAEGSITVTYSAITYSVAVTQPNRGLTISANRTTASAGDVVELSAVADYGYVMGTWVVKDAADNDVAVSDNAFTMPATDVTVTATVGFDNNAYVVLQSACAGHTDRFVCPTEGSENPIIDVITRRDAPAMVFQLQHYDLDQDRSTLSSYFWLFNPYYRRWMGEPLNTTARVGFVTEEFKNAQGNSKWGWAGVFNITQTNGAFQLWDKNPSNSYSNKWLALKDDTLIVGSNSATAALAQWDMHVVTPYAVSVTLAEGDGSFAYSGNNLYGADQEALASGTCYFEGAPDADGFTATAVVDYTPVIEVDNTNRVITLIYHYNKCATPSINRSGNDFSFGCSFPSSGVTIKYTTDGSDPVNGTVYSGTAVHVDDNDTLKVVAVATGCYNSDVVELFVAPSATGAGTEATPYVIEYLSQLYEVDADLGAHYLLGADIDATGFGGVTGDFTGTFDGGFHTITGLSYALFCKVAGGTVKNVTVDNVVINSGVNVGALANEATGYARIYNCQVLATGSRSDIADPANEDKAFTSSSTLRGSGAVGGIVGKISGNVRVVNCVSYADVNGGTYGAGIVGQYEGSWITNTDTTVSDDGIMVMNCLMLGDVKSGSTQMSPVVGGNKVTATISTWDYFRYASMPNVQNMKNNQNGALTIDEDKWLKRYEFFRSCLNNHRDLAAIYCFSDTTHKSEMAKWTIDESISPWPILKAHDHHTRKTLDRTIPDTTVDNAGKQLGSLAVTAIINGSSRTVNLPITDMDHAHHDYTWGKVILPFANEFQGWTPQTTTTEDYDKIIIGWEITSLTGGTTGTFSDYNFADRDCTAKDVYDATNNPFIYAQGGMFIVPNGVTAITITAHWANAFYLADEYYDMDISTMPFSDTYTPSSYINCGGLQRTTYNGKTIYHSLREAQAKMSTDYLCDKQAIVLVGNYHFRDSQKDDNRRPTVSKGFTIMSIDEDADQEPDYGVFNALARDQIYHIDFPAARWDFIPTYATGIFQKAAKRAMLFSVPKMRGWWEFTETCLARSYELEAWDAVHANADNGHGNNAFIINGGYHTQFIRGRSGTYSIDRLSYVKVGGKAFVKEFFQGNHTNDGAKWKLIPTNVTGGEITYCYMTGQSTKNNTGEYVMTTNNNVRFYCSGGKIGKFLGCYMEYPVNNVTANIDHAIIDKFYGGGTTQAGHVRGNIVVNIKNSYVENFCGGPEFGNMESEKTVTVNADNTTFGTYYGAGFGGTAMTRIKSGANNGEQGDYQTASSAIDDYNSYYLQSKTGGIGVYYEIEEFMNARGQYYFRFYNYVAEVNLAQTGNVTSTLTNCKILGNFYGGGCQGKVEGKITSTLTNCNVLGSVFGGGYKASATDVDVYTRLTTWPKFDDTFGAFDAVEYPTPEKYKWEYVTSLPGSVSGTNANGEKVIYTTTDMSTMGEVSGKITLTLDGGRVGGSVFGGGNESLAKETEVSVKGSVEHPLNIEGSVFGGGNNAAVKKDTKVTVSGTITIDNNVYGGGNGGEVEGDTQVTIGEE